MTEPAPAVISGEVQPFELSRRQVGWTLSAHFLSSASIGVAIGGIVPLISVTLEARGVDTVIIGVNSAMTSIGVILAAPFVPSIVRALGAGWAIVAGLIFATLATIGLGLVDELWVWLLLRLLMGVGVVTHWVVSETWMQAIVSERRRGLVMSVYVTSIAAGFASGPVVLSFTGTAGLLPFIVFATMIGLTALPMIPIRHLVPPLALNERGSALRLLRQAPTIATAALAVGLVDAAFFTFLPLYGLRVGVPKEEALLLLTAVLGGNVLLQIPLGWLADKVSRRGLLIGLAAICVAGPVITAPFILSGSWIMYPLGVIWGGAAFGIYTVGVTMLGERYRGGELASANAAFVVCFEIANITGPPVAGLAMELWAPHGLMAYMTIVSAGFLLLAIFRGAQRAVQSGS